MKDNDCSWKIMTDYDGSWSTFCSMLLVWTCVQTYVGTIAQPMSTALKG